MPLCTIIGAGYDREPVITVVIQNISLIRLNGFIFRNDIQIFGSIRIIINEIHLIANLNLVKVIEYLSIYCAVMSCDTIIALAECAGALKMSC